MQGLLSFLPIMSGNVLMMLAALVIMFVLSPLLAIISLVVVPALLVVSYRMRRRVFPATWDGQQREGDVAQIVDEDVNGVRVVKAFGQEQRELGRIAAAAGRLYGSRMRAVRLQARYQPLLEAIPSLAQVAILAVGGWMALHHRISIGTFLAFSTYVGQFAAPARQLAGILTVGQQARAGVERIFQLLDLPPAIADAPDAVELPELRGDIVFDGVDFGYPDGPPVLARLRPAHRRGRAGRPHRRQWQRQVDGGRAAGAIPRPRRRRGSPSTATTCATVTLHSLRAQLGIRVRGELPVLRLGPGQHRLRTPGRDRCRDRGRRAGRRGARVHPRPAARLRHGRRRARADAVRRAAAAHRARPGDPHRPARPVLDDATSAVDARTEEQIHDALREHPARPDDSA